MFFLLHCVVCHTVWLRVVDTILWYVCLVSFFMFTVVQLCDVKWLNCTYIIVVVVFFGYCLKLCCTCASYVIMLCVKWVFICHLKKLLPLFCDLLIVVIYDVIFIVFCCFSTVKLCCSSVGWHSIVFFRLRETSIIAIVFVFDLIRPYICPHADHVYSVDTV